MSPSKREGKREGGREGEREGDTGWGGRQRQREDGRERETGREERGGEKREGEKGEGRGRQKSEGGREGEREGGRGGGRVRGELSHLLAHPPQAHSSWAGPEPKLGARTPARSPTRVAGIQLLGSARQEPGVRVGVCCVRVCVCAWYMCVGVYTYVCGVCPKQHLNRQARRPPSPVCQSLRCASPASPRALGADPQQEQDLGSGHSPEPGWNPAVSALSSPAPRGGPGGPSQTQARAFGACRLGLRVGLHPLSVHFTVGR